MFGIGTGEIVFILALVLIIFGPARIPEFSRGIGAGLKQLREAFKDIKEKSGIDELEGEISRTQRELTDFSRKSLNLDSIADLDSEPDKPSDPSRLN